MAIKLVNFGFNDKGSAMNDKGKAAYVIRGNNLKVSKHSKPLKRFENKSKEDGLLNEEEVANMPDLLGEAMCCQQKLSIDQTDLVPKGVIKRPYSAHGFKVVNKNLKLRKTQEVNLDDYVSAYKEKILASDKVLLFDLCCNGHKEDKKPSQPVKAKKKKLTKRYMEPFTIVKAKAPGGLTCDDECDIEEVNEDIEKIGNARQLLQNNGSRYKHTNEMLAELRKVAPSDDVNKLMVSMAENFEANDQNTNQCKAEIDEEAENRAYEQLNERIKRQIKEKGTYDFSQLSKEDRELLLKKKIYSKPLNSTSMQKKKTKARPLTSKAKPKQREEEIKSTQEPKKKKKFQNEPNQTFNECLEYIPKPPMNGFLLRAYKHKPKSQIMNDDNETEDNERYSQFKAKPAPKFEASTDTKVIAHPMLADYGKV